LKNESLTGNAWNRIFEELSISERIKSQGIFSISASKISKISGREPRLMAKFDQRKHRPQILDNHGITILPVSNGEYALLSGDGYIDIPQPTQVQPYGTSKIDNIRSIPWREGIGSEPQAIDTLFMASAIKEFVGDQTLVPTIRGKFRSRPFDFQFTTSAGAKTIAVAGPQIEIDSGYEGEVLVLLEAKLGSIEDTIVRQLYYPFKHFESLRLGKQIICLLLVYSNKVYSLYEFLFGSSNLYQSASISRHVHYVLEPTPIPPRFADVISRRTIAAPKGVPFPQADDLSKIIDVTELLAAGPQDKSGIAERFDVDPRQGDYYGNSAVWLGLAEKYPGNFQATELGKEFAKLDSSSRLARLADLVTKMPIFHEAADEFANGNQPDLNEITRLVKNDFKLSKVTAKRRALTVRSWIQWLALQLRT
jgi:hypothetical protein